MERKFGWHVHTTIVYLTACLDLEFVSQISPDKWYTVGVRVFGEECPAISRMDWLCVVGFVVDS